MVLETDKLAVPVLPTNFDGLPQEVIDYLMQVNDYLQAVHRDMRKIGGVV